jgi:multiple sugar transport system permease protein
MMVVTRLTPSLRSRDLVAGIVLFLVLLFFLFPIAWIVTLAFKTQADIFAFPPKFFGFVPTLEHFQAILTGPNSFLPYVGNSLIVATSSTVLSVVLGTLAGYATARWKSIRAQKAAFYILSTRMLPPIAVVIPMYLVFRWLGMLESFTAIIVAHTIFNLPLVTWLTRSFFSDLPVELEEAAKVDGCTVPRTFAYITLPLAAPGIATAAIFAFLFSWNEFLFSLILTNSDTQTLPIAIVRFQSSSGTMWGEMAAASTISFVPVLLVGLAVQRYLVRGLTAGAVKG